jgi:hypothetical protein
MSDADNTPAAARLDERRDATGQGASAGDPEPAATDHVDPPGDDLRGTMSDAAESHTRRARRGAECDRRCRGSWHPACER